LVAVAAAVAVVWAPAGAMIPPTANRLIATVANVLRIMMVPFRTWAQVV
jgi:hypothetical protein